LLSQLLIRDVNSRGDSLDRQRKSKRRSPAVAILGPDAPAVRLDNPLADGQAQADAARVAIGIAARRAEEFMKHLLRWTARQARAAIEHFNHHRAVFAPRVQLQRAAR